MRAWFCLSHINDLEIENLDDALAEFVVFILSLFVYRIVRGFGWLHTGATWSAIRSHSHFGTV